MSDLEINQDPLVMVTPHSSADHISDTTCLSPAATARFSIRESVDSLCRDGADTPMPPYIGKAFTRTNFEDLSLFRYMIMVCE